MKHLTSCLAGITILASIFCFTASANNLKKIGIEETQQFLASLNKPGHLRGQFSQQKKLHELPFPLTSSGNFEFSKDKGLHWQTATPIQSDLWLTDSYILQQQDGKKVFQVNLKEQPVAQLIGNIFFAVLGGNWQQLEHHFNISLVSVSNENKEWEVTLTPKDTAFKNFASHINISGSTYINHFTLTEANSDKTTILFSNISEQH